MMIFTRKHYQNMIAKLKKQLKVHEGVRDTVYYDTMGIPTIGVGFNLQRKDAKEKLALVGANLQEVLAGKPLTDKQIEDLLDICIQEATSDALSLVPDLQNLSPVRQRVIIDMAYNLGKNKLSMFRTFLANINDKRFSQAARAMTKSVWFFQVGERGIRLAEMMLDDIDPFL